MLKAFVFSCRQKFNFILHAFLELLQRYGSLLFLVLRVCLVRHIQNDTVNLQKTSMFIYTPKVNCIIYFLLEILHLAGSIWSITRGPEFCQMSNWWWNINNNISLHFRLFPRKSNDNSFQYNNLIWSRFGPFLPKLKQKWIFLEKRAQSVFKYSNYLPSCQKSEKKLMSHSWEKCHAKTDRQTHRRTDRQTTLIL